MTAIAYRDGIMAADSLASDANYIKFGTVKKIVRAPDGALGASAGHTGVCSRFRRWFSEGNFSLDNPFDPTNGENDDWQALIVLPSGEVHHQIMKHVFQFDAPFHVLGSADLVILGAMAAGANAEEAVRIAIEYVAGCGGEIQIESLIPPTD